jgi:uncharacterized protein YabN with tetrapyrrole methylase and pyrophosphatase domain
VNSSDPSSSIHESPVTNHFAKLCEIVAKLRAPGGCPWDREQTHESLLPATIEEAYEVAEAARSKNAAHFREELGDLLLLVVMHAEIARESGQFKIDNVVEEITEKLIRRHPHVFGTVAASASPGRTVSPAKDPRAAAGTAATTAGAVLKQWEAIKREEKKDDQHYLASLPRALPALMRAQKAQSKVARVNFDWTELGDVIAKVEEELGELKSAISAEDEESIKDETGDLLFAVVNLARKCRLDAESALQAATDKFVSRFNLLEDELRTRGKTLGDVDLAELDAIWNEIKMTKDEGMTKPESPTA